MFINSFADSYKIRIFVAANDEQKNKTDSTFPLGKAIVLFVKNIAAFP